MLASHVQDALDGPRGVVGEGDLAIVVDRNVPVKMVTISQTGTFQGRSGMFKMKDWIGKEWGTRLLNQQGREVVVVKPTPELWTEVLTHRTQILYLPDISMILLKLELRPGSIVLETGTGTGSLSTSLARAVYPGGRVFTFEYHEERAAKAKIDFENHGLSQVVKVTRRDTQANGFPEEFCMQADAVFLDLPNPWLAVGSAFQCLKPDRMLCSFSPCIEQVQRTLEELHEYGFKDFETMEILTREHLLAKDPDLSMIDVLFEQREGAALKDTSGDVDASDRGLAEGEACQGRKRKKDAGGENSEGRNGKEDRKCSGSRSNATISRPEYKTRGHTGYLTFCRKPAGGVAGNQR
jgi:tRNA (adenine57-N1/adenine58-N1)-methyltransferase